MGVRSTVLQVLGNLERLVAAVVLGHLDWGQGVDVAHTLTNRLLLTAGPAA